MNLASLADDNLEKLGEYERLVFEGKSYTNRQLHERSLCLAGSLRQLGTSPDDKVVVLMMNAPEVLVSYPAIWRVGAVAVPVLFLLEAHEIAYILENSGARMVITSPELHPKLVEAMKLGGKVEHVIVAGEAPQGTLAFDQLASEGEPLLEAVPRGDDDLAVILYTSGTTGKPKGVMQTHANIRAAVTNAWESSTKKELHVTSLLALPLAHSFGLGVLVGGYLFGGKAILMRWFEPEAALRLIEEHRVRAMAGVPTMFVYLMNHPKAGQYDTSSMERWLVGAAPMPVEQKRQFEEKLGGTLYVGYGLTEACPGISTEREGLPRKPGSCGVPMEGVEVKIVDFADDELPRGEPGEIIARGNNISPGYYQLPKQTAETFRDGWLYTGDIGRLDEDGYLFVIERKKDLVIRGGFNVYPKDVEEVLAAHPAVQECAVVGVPDELMGEEVCGFVVTRSEVTPEELIAHCQAHLAKYKTPKHVAIVPALPKNPIGKVQKREIRKLAAERFRS